MDLGRPEARRRAVRAALVVALCLVVTAVGLMVALPGESVAAHWSVAWAGLDLATALTAVATAALLLRSDPRAALTATAGAALLVLDAWFDITTAATTAQTWLAVIEAVVLELPLAALAAGFATSWLRRPSPAETVATHPSPARRDPGIAGARRGARVTSGSPTLGRSP